MEDSVLQGQLQGVTYPEGFHAGSLHVGIRRNTSKDDVALIYSEVCASGAAVYTTNLVKADCVLYDMEVLSDGKVQAVIINSGNANAAAPEGFENARRMAQAAAKKLSIPADLVAVSSTGVIGQRLPVEKIETGLDVFAFSSDETGGMDAAKAIMTTDTRVKIAQRTFEIGGKTCRMGAICKGSGMIHPNMGTMLCFITTDAAIPSALLEKALKKDVTKTFNRISVDGDTSTNDMVLVMANGMSGCPEIQADSEEYEVFEQALRSVMEEMAIAIARDGEGASRLLTVTVKDASSEGQAEKLARSVVSSSLTKAAMFGSDANWGRVLCAMGYSGQDFDPKKTDIYFASAQGTVQAASHGRGLEFDEELASRILSDDAVEIVVSLNEGDDSVSCWGCDLTYDYVKINGDYRT